MASFKDDKSIPELKVRKFTKGLEISGFQRAKAVALCPNGEIVVVDTRSGTPCAYILSKLGVYKQTLMSPTSRPQGKLLNVEGVAITALGHIVVVDQSETVKLFNVEGKYLYSFTTISKEENNGMVDTACVAVDNENRVLVGDFRRQVVTIHDGTDGSLVQKLTLIIRPCYLAVNRKQHIIITDWMSRTVEAVNYNGDVLYTFTTSMDGKEAQPRGIVCDKNDNIYIVVAEYDKAIDNTKINSGRILKYNSKGQYLGSVVEGLYWPHGIALHNGSFYVANSLSVTKINM